MRVRIRIWKAVAIPEGVANANSFGDPVGGANANGFGDLVGG